MKIKADTYILFAILLFSKSRSKTVLFNIMEHHTLILCNYIIVELMDLLSRKDLIYYLILTYY